MLGFSVLVHLCRVISIVLFLNLYVFLDLLNKIFKYLRDILLVAIMILSSRPDINPLIK